MSIGKGKGRGMAAPLLITLSSSAFLTSQVRGG